MVNGYLPPRPKQEFFAQLPLIAAVSALPPAQQKILKSLKRLAFSLWHSFCTSPDAAAWESAR
jgi:hypothetical protein